MSLWEFQIQRQKGTESISIKENFQYGLHSFPCSNRAFALNSWLHFERFPSKMEKSLKNYSRILLIVLRTSDNINNFIISNQIFTNCKRKISHQAEQLSFMNLHISPTWHDCLSRDRDNNFILLPCFYSMSWYKFLILGKVIV